MPSMQNAIDSHNASIKQVPQTDEKSAIAGIKTNARLTVNVALTELFIWQKL